MKELIIKKTIEIEKAEASIKKKLNDFFYSFLFKDILDIFEDKNIINTKSFLIEKILKGVIFYKDNAFYGNFSARDIGELVRLGGKIQNKRVILEYNKLTSELRNAINNYQLKRQALIQKIQDNLNQKIINIEEIAKISINEEWHRITSSINEQFEVSKDLTVNPTFTEQGAKQMAEQYTQNLQLSIKDWTDKKILEMRQEAQDKILSGTRIENLQKYFQEKYAVSKSKAEFLAKEETRLIYSVYHQQKASNNGIRYFKWRHSKVPKKPRFFHIFLDNLSKNNKIIYDIFNLPINPQTNQPEFPGNDFGCGCIAVYLVGTLEELQAQGYKLYKQA